MSELTDLTMLYWVGSGAESTLQFVGDAETKLIKSVRHCFWVWVKPETGHALDTLITTLSSVLPDVTLTDSKAVLGPQNFWLLPRKGMVSPWASKALDIVHRCCLTNVVRLEKVVF